MTHAICFDLPDKTDPVFATVAGGLTPFLSEAVRFRREQDAEETLHGLYGPETRAYGVVVEVDGG